MIDSAQPKPPALEIIRAGTRLRPVPLVPQIRLYQAGDPINLWQRTELAAGRTGLDPPFWAFAWAGGQALARYLLDHPGQVRGRQVTDLASGSGLVAIAAARAGAASVTAYDIDPLATAAIDINAAANGVTVRAVCADVLDEDGPPSPGTDLVLAGDAFYERDLAARVMRFLERGHARGTAVTGQDCGAAGVPAPRPPDPGRHLRRSRPADAGGHRHQAHDRLGAPARTAIEEPLDLIGAARRHAGGMAQPSRPCASAEGSCKTVVQKAVAVAVCMGEDAHIRVRSPAARANGR